MSILDKVIAGWHKLPIAVTSVISSLAVFDGQAALRYLTETNPQVLSWGGLGAAVLAGLANWADSYVRLHQLPPEK